MSVESETIATTIFQLVNDERSTKEELELLKESNIQGLYDEDIRKREKELKNITEELDLLYKRIENKLYEITIHNPLSSADPVAILSDKDFISINGLTFLSNKELEKIREYLGTSHYDVQPYIYYLTLYFHNGKTWEV